MATWSKPPANHQPFLVLLVFDPKRRHNTPPKIFASNPQVADRTVANNRHRSHPKNIRLIMQNFGNPHTPFAGPPPPLPFPNAPSEFQESYLEPSQMGGLDARSVRLFYEEPATAEEHRLAAAKL
ncbi:hypothetical protein PCANC_00644 [Puccinia coronata f. sp. avenae]|uniref:Uncharacterized protein n=1 Tax=Puccinia coronata f. sp. avenae TaxID=200324 RepID=A0A2N5W706_9BASI|nr:hypothetical protein PCANC_00644 [Puccinia coronata f. sp. avenae]